MKIDITLKYFIGLVLVLSLFLSATADERDIGVIKNPQPNITETTFAKLEKVATISSDLGNGQYIYFPGSLDMDSQKNLYIYDKAQARVIVLDKNLKFKYAFGREGIGPGEFLRKRSIVSLRIGQDGNLYAHDMSANKTLVFTCNGKYLKQFTRKTGCPRKPIIGPKGNHYEVDCQDNGDIRFFSGNNITQFSLKLTPKEMSYLFHKPDIRYFDDDKSDKVLVELLTDNKWLIYFKPSSTIAIVKDKQVVKKFSLLPKAALENHKTGLESVLAKSNKKVFGYSFMFSRLFSDRDREDVFYLSYVIDEQKGMNLLHQFNTEGKFLKVLYRKVKPSDAPALFFVKKDNQFYGIEDENIVIYREVDNET